MTHAASTWLQFAEQELGIQTFGIGMSNPRIEEYHNTTSIAGYDDKAAWCSSFINWVFAQSKISGTGSALARSWLDWGFYLAEPERGCVVVLEREHPKGWQGHVGFFLRSDENRIFLLGGNQLDEVREHHYPISSVLGYRWPSQLSNASQ